MHCGIISQLNKGFSRQATNNTLQSWSDSSPKPYCYTSTDASTFRKAENASIAVRVHTTVFVAYLIVHTKTLEDDKLVEVRKKQRFRRITS